MAAGKVLALISGIITLVATFILSWVSINVPPVYYAYGIGIVKNLLPMFTNAEGLGTQLGIPGFAIYIIAGISIAFLASGILQLIGIKSRALSIIGSIIVCVFALLIIFGTFDIIVTTEWLVYIFGDSEPLIPDIIPFDLSFGPFSLGLFVLIAGGVLGLVSSAMSREF